MDYNKNDFKTWDEAARWLQRHGYGIEQIRLEKDSWDSVNTVKAADKPEVVVAPKVVEAAPKPMSKTVGTKTTATAAPKTK
jgi:hypothetical protein